ncbi:MlaC/ttg2D family ABC transporter substrate-binding protein [Haliangium sp.]|uniref:MlaC/ttg2D family ABC transporter substrate-binding protein n=1 Tax=Haliangium sp. TaxID=2663208 RepID=UPI003D0AF850
MTSKKPPFAALAVCLVTVAGLLWSAPARAGGDGDGTRAVRSANDTIAKLLRRKVEPGSAEEKRLATRVTESVRAFLDVDELGRQALVDHWDRLEEAKRNEFLSVLRQLIERNYVRGLRANLDYQVAYTGERRDGDTLRVATEIHTKRRGRPYTVSIDYVLRRQGKDWRAFDVVTDGVGLVENYRAMFNKIITKEGFDGLLRRMKKKLAELG